jgi:hypothetical protein
MMMTEGLEPIRKEEGVITDEGGLEQPREECDDRPTDRIPQYIPRITCNFLTFN